MPKQIHLIVDMEVSCFVLNWAPELPMESFSFSCAVVSHPIIAQVLFSIVIKNNFDHISMDM